MSVQDLPLVTTSERGAVRRCPQLWEWRFRDGFEPRFESADARWFGIGVHIALADWYQRGKRRGPHPADTFEQWSADWGENMIRSAREEWMDRPKWEDATKLGVSMLEGYIDEYGRDSNWRIISIEQPFKVRVIRKGRPIAIFMSTWDGVYFDENTGEIYLLENKTASQIATAYLSLDDQAGIYWAVAQNVLLARKVLKPGQQIAGITYNFLRKAMKDERKRGPGGAYLNQDGKESKRQPPPRFVRETVPRLPSENRAQLNRLADEVAVMNAYRDGTLPVTKNTNKDCTWCDFFSMCQLHERGGDAWRELAAAEYVQRDPYARYTKSAGSA